MKNDVLFVEVVDGKSNSSLKVDEENQSSLTFQRYLGKRVLTVRVLELKSLMGVSDRLNMRARAVTSSSLEH